MGTQAGANGAQHAAGPESAERHSRYRVSAKNQRPPALEAVLKALGKAARRIGTFKQPDEVRGIFASAHKAYAERGAADDFYRFLRNHGVLVRDGDEGEIYFDQMRGQLLAAACAEGTPPPSVADSAAQLAELKEQAVQRRERPSSPGGETGEHLLPVEDAGSAFEEQRDEFAEMLLGESDEELLRLQATFAADRVETRRRLLETEWHNALVAGELARREEIRMREERRRALEKEAARRRSELDELESSRTAKAEELARLEADLAKLAAQS